MPKKLRYSTDFASRKPELIAGVAKAFGWGPGQLYPPPEFYERMRHFWTMPIDEGVKDRPVRSQQQGTWQHLFAERKASGYANRNRVREQNPAIMDVVDAILDQYTQCFYWQERAEEMKDANPSAESELLFEKRCKTIERVRAQIGPYYTLALMEQGHSRSDAMKIVGSAIYGFTEAACRMTRKIAEVHPTKHPNEPPSKLLPRMISHADRAYRESQDKEPSR